MKPGRQPEPNFLNSNCANVQDDLQYTQQDIQHIQDWVKRAFSLFPS